ncbi:MAG: hypothetical protein HWN67_13745 [Candidatus Helarchaeota archaeon]|nr:hypothetical protein [Candidatus Helarchaeota archaeon]
MDYHELQELLDKRTYFIGDRVAVSQILFLLFSGSIVFLLELLDLSNFVINTLWWIFLLVLPIITIILIIIKKVSLYFNHHWLLSSQLFLIIWSSFTIYLGIFVDEFYGYGNALFVSLFIAFIYFIGYALSKMFRKIRNSFSEGTLAGWILFISITLIAVTVGFGIYIYNIGTKTIQDEQLIQIILIILHIDYIPKEIISLAPVSVEYSAIVNSLTCRIGIYVMLTGIGIVVSMLLHYFMFYCLHDPKGLDVEENPPNQLYIRIMIVSIILTFISWILLLVLFPPIPAGGKKRGRRSGSKKKGKSRVYSSRYRTYRYYGTDPPEGYSEVLTEAEWKEYELGKDRRRNQSL